MNRLDNFGLSEKEIQTLHWVSQGKTYTEIAEILCIATTTINNRMVKVYRKIGAQNAAGAVGIAIRKGLVK